MYTLEAKSNEDQLQELSSVKRVGIRKIFLLLLVASLCVASLIAIYVFLFGKFRETEIRLLLTTLSVGGFSLTGLCCSVLYERNRYVWFAILGVAVSVAGFISSIQLVWGNDKGANVFDNLLTCIVLAVSIAHASLLLIIETNKKFINICRILTMMVIAVVASMLIYEIYNFHFFYSREFFYRLLGVFAVLDVLGTIITPMLKKFNT